MADADKRPRAWVGHVFLESQDVDATETFLREAIGIRPIFKDDAMAVMELRGGTHIVLRQADGEHEAGFDLMVEDLEALHRDLAQAGHGPSPIEAGRIHRSFEVTDPGGLRLRFNSSHVGQRVV
ncbi:MAG: VOC family protein [Sandaracinaceae bacterium]